MTSAPRQAKPSANSISNLDIALRYHFFGGLEHVVPKTAYAALRARVGDHSGDARARRGRHAGNMGDAGGAPTSYPAQYAADEGRTGGSFLVGRGRRSRATLPRWRVRRGVQ